MWALLLVSLAVTYADATHAAQCPQVKLIKNFDLASYAQGIWYEIARYRNDIEGLGNCVRTNYTRKDEDYVIEVDEIEDKKHIVHDGYLNLVSSDHLSGLVNYVFQDSTMSVDFNVTFLAVDNNSYAIKYICQIDPKTGNRMELAWIMSRTEKLTNSAKADIDNFFSHSDILDKNLFFWDEFSDEVCNYTTSNIERRLPNRLINYSLNSNIQNSITPSL